jgi:gluconate/galactonate dehydratase
MSARPDVTITDVQTTRVDGNFNWTLVRVYSDAGIAGTGEAYWGSGVTDLVQEAGSRIVGENPCDIDRLYTEMVEGLSAQGSIGGAGVTAISGIEMALHDLAGKLLDVPAYQLLGGKYRDDVRVYVDCHAGAHSTEDTDGAYSPAAYADAAEAVAAEGYDALKFDLDTRGESDEYNRHLSAEDIAYMEELVAATTERVDVDVAFDCHWNYSGDSARRLADAVEEYDVWWLEDPIPPENHDVQREVTRGTATTICAGENVYRKHGVRQLIEEQAVDIVQPDMPKVGGMGETVRIAEMADTYYLPVALHNVSTPLGTVAGAHVAAAAPTFLAIEYHSRELDWWSDVVQEDVMAAGRLRVPDDPGLGVTLDRDVVAANLMDGETLFDPAPEA